MLIALFTLGTYYNNLVGKIWLSSVKFKKQVNGVEMSLYQELTTFKRASTKEVQLPGFVYPAISESIIFVNSLDRFKQLLIKTFIL